MIAWRPKVLQKYFVIEILRAVLFVLIAFLALFAFFDLMGELKSVGHGGYRLQHAFLYVMLNMPGYLYDLMPIAALIGTIYVLAQFAARSEFTIMRVSGLSPRRAGWMMAKIGFPLVLLTFIFGEFIAPATNAIAEKMKLRVQGAMISQEFRSGLWAKDVIKDQGLQGNIIGSRFLNVREVQPDGQLRDVKLYEFDRDFHLTTLVLAAHASYQDNHTWRLSDVTETRFSAGGDQLTSTQSIANKELVSEITPDILAVLFTDPDRMSAYGLSAYTKHLEENKQRTERYEIAFWKKMTYPFAILVMMALALPFAYLNNRAGGVSLKIFSGIMIGVSFQLLNSLFSHLGLLHTWPALATALLPSGCFLLIAIAALWWVERR